MKLVSRVPLIVAPMAGGPSTPELLAAAATAGASGFLGAGYLSTEALDGQIERTRALGVESFGVNLFVPTADSGAPVAGYAERLAAEARRYGAELGQPRWEDDEYQAKAELLLARRVPVVSFTFGHPAAELVTRFKDVGTEVWVTVTTPEEARIAADVGVDVLVVQGMEAGGHRGAFANDPAQPGAAPLYGLLAALRLIGAVTELPLVATGGLVHGADIAAVLTAGAAAAQLGTAFLRCPEAGTQPAQRAALAAGDRETALTRAFTGRPARGLVNRVLTEHSAAAPAAYPQLHHLTRPLRAAAAKAGDPEAMSLWAGQTYPLAPELPAAELVALLMAQARDAWSRACGRWLDQS
ncbi:nitronate monooxygenase [Crossiella sp. CA-258035]|uniref:nitronate monooxygenase n=1 Tax=Crossiella sp. CA-258035 TaxID=2981138 RepID=UPI0024BD26C1|nr:nitronate monooxygenase [Crossiella sp. CA-258035]WHT20875.1 nitronate monooxygenase [Crossiella sp. CA-258035]